MASSDTCSSNSNGAWEVVVMESAPSSSTSSRGSDDSWKMPGIEPDEERVYHFKNMHLMPETLMKFHRNGYTAWTSASGGGIVETTEEIWNSIGVPLGEQEKLQYGIDAFRRGLEDSFYGMPGGNLRQGLLVDINHLIEGLNASSETIIATGHALNAGDGDSDDQSSHISGDIPSNASSSAPDEAPEETPGAPKASNWLWHMTITIPVLVLVLSSIFISIFRVGTHTFGENVFGGLMCMPFFALGIQPLFIIIPGHIFGQEAHQVSTSAMATALTVAVLTECLDGETPVLNQDRVPVRLCEIKNGDFVLGWNKRRCVVSRVLKVTRNQVTADHLCRVVLGESTTIIATKNHPFWVDGKKWCSVVPDEQAELRTEVMKVGDYCRDVSGKKLQITAIDNLKSDSDPSALFDVFNLVIDGPGTWFANGVLNHSGMYAKRVRKENCGSNDFHKNVLLKRPKISECV